ncbi:MAG: hypothetical protein PVH85_31355 [Desulfobacterales bacterium]|jgi:hypothetical protein
MDSYEATFENFVGFAKNSEFVMPVPDQVRDDGSGIQNNLEFLDSGYRIESGTGPAGMTS